MSTNKMIILSLIIFAALAVGGAKVYSAIRGIRNNNPLNIELGDDWQGLAPEQTDGVFCQFIDPIYGIRAAARNLITYSKSGINTIEKIISTWAPPKRLVNGEWVFENDTASYISSVERQTGFDRKKVMNKNAGDYLPLLKAMIRQENGINPYSDETILQGIALA